MSKVKVTFTTDPKVRNEAERITNTIGLSLSSSINIYLRQICFQHKIPLTLSLPKNKLSDNKYSIQKALDSFANGNNGEEHHLIDTK